MKIHQLDIPEALASLHTSAAGLDAMEAARRLREYGPNRVEEVRRGNRLLDFLKEFTHFFSMVLWIAAGLAFLAEWSEPGQGMARIGYALVVVIVVSSLFSFWQEHRVEKTLAALRSLLPSRVETVRDGAVVQIPAEQVVSGDIILLEQGDTVPADCRLIEAFGVRVNNSTVTGESLPQSRDALPSPVEDVLHGKNVLLTGTSIVSGQTKAVVFATGMDTEFGRIAHLTQISGEAISPLRRELAHLSRVIVLLALLIGLLFFLVGRFIGISFWEDFIFTIGIIVAMVPEGLQPTLTLALVLATQRMAKRHVLIRHLPSVEALGSTTVICTDKTGTLTQNRMAVKTLFLGRLVELATDSPLTGIDIQAHQPFFLATLRCHNLQASRQGAKTVYLGDPMEVALVQLAERAVPADIPPRRVDELPFDAERMRLSTVYEMPQGRALYCKGAPETVLPLCSGLFLAGAVQPLSTEQRAAIASAQEAMTSRGLRVIAVAYRMLGAGEVTEEQDLIFAGLAGLEDPPRPEVPEAIRRCHEAGIKVIMVTGDHPRTAVAIAREIGLLQSDAPVVLSGNQLRRMSPIQLQLALDAPEILFARVAADQKMRIVEVLKQKGHIVAATGDGVNDAPALKSAHIGIAMGITGADVAKEAADMVLLDDNFASIVNAVEEGRAVFENIRKFLTYILAHNVPELIPYLAMVLFKLPLALLPLQILAIDMGTDSITALGLGVEQPDPEVMKKPPRPQQERLFSLGVALRAYVFLGLIEAVTAMAAFFFVLKGGGWSYGQALASTVPLYLIATTACLSAIIIMQVVNVFLCRSATRSVFATGVFGNAWIAWGVVLEIGLISVIDYTSWGNALFGTAPLPPAVWLFMLPFAGFLFLFEEVRKWLVRC